MEIKDVTIVADIWLETSLTAHSFIPDSYWKENKVLMEEKYLPHSEVYVVEEKGIVLGFIALIENHIASIFIKEKQQGRGIGSLLLNYVKEINSELTLNVYQKNKKSVNFYKAKGFQILNETIDHPTGEKEFHMRWRKTET